MHSKTGLSRRSDGSPRNDEKANLGQTREGFIKAAISFIEKDGWKDDALKKASEAHFKDPLYYKTLFDSVADIVDQFEYLEDKKLIKKFGQKKKDDSFRGFIGNLVLYRIKEISPEMHKALKDYYLSLKHIDEAGCAVWNTADVIWKAAGDQSTDMNYYSKRFLLSSVYTMSIRHYAKHPSDIDAYVLESLDKLVKRMQKFKIPKMEDIPILRLFS
jgi:ubiquinone biosynthesis protein COQ9